MSSGDKPARSSVARGSEHLEISLAEAAKWFRLFNTVTLHRVDPSGRIKCRCPAWSTGEAGVELHMAQISAPAINPPAQGSENAAPLNNNNDG